MQLTNSAIQINRLYFKKLWNERKGPEISILLGARQVGKSTLLRQLESQAKDQGLSTTFYDLEQPSQLNQLTGKDAQVIETLTSGAKVVFIDEFHYLKNASKIFKAIYDRRKGIKIYASGSSSIEMHKHLKESLAGRFIKTMIFPLSLKEWQQVPGFQEEAYLQWGGLPGLLQRSSAEERMGLLENIMSTYITRDIKGLVKEENVRAFNALLYFLAQTQGSVVNTSNLARETGLSESTVARHIDIISHTYVLHAIPSYSQNLANELKKSKKYYLFDLGIRNMLLKDFRSVSQRDDKGVLYESVVLFHLMAQLKPNMELRFWRTKKGDEVDFILLKNRIPLPIEVKSSLSKPDVPKGIIQFLQRYAAAPYAVVYNENLETRVVVENRPVYFKRWEKVEELEYLRDII